MITNILVVSGNNKKEEEKRRETPTMMRNSKNKREESRDNGQRRGRSDSRGRSKSGTGRSTDREKGGIKSIKEWREAQRNESNKIARTHASGSKKNPLPSQKGKYNRELSSAEPKRSSVQVAPLPPFEDRHREFGETVTWNRNGVWMSINNIRVPYELRERVYEGTTTNGERVWYSRYTDGLHDRDDRRSITLGDDMYHRLLSPESDDSQDNGGFYYPDRKTKAGNYPKASNWKEKQAIKERDEARNNERIRDEEEKRQEERRKERNNQRRLERNERKVGSYEREEYHREKGKENRRYDEMSGGTFEDPKRKKRYVNENDDVSWVESHKKAMPEKGMAQKGVTQKANSSKTFGDQWPILPQNNRQKDQSGMGQKSTPTIKKGNHEKGKEQGGNYFQSWLVHTARLEEDSFVIGEMEGDESRKWRRNLEFKTQNEVPLKHLFFLLVDKRNREMCCDERVNDPTFMEIPMGGHNRYVVVLMIKTGVEGGNMIKARKIGVIVNGELMVGNQNLNGEVTAIFAGRLALPTSRIMEGIIAQQIKVLGMRQNLEQHRERGIEEQEGRMREWITRKQIISIILATQTYSK